ncbi:MAG: CapA family protein [Clostridia bacterium]|nr:CapA family protein [Clostridia bacterium]
MGKNMTKGGKRPEKRESRRPLRTGAMGLLVAVGVASMAGMALFNANAKPNRDMKWYVNGGDVQVAAPAMGEGYASGGEVRTGERREGTARRLGIVSPEGKDAQEEEDEAGPVTADLTAEPTRSATEAPTQEPTQLPTAVPAETLSPVTGEAQPGAVTRTITAAGDCTFGGELGSQGRRRFVDLAQQNGSDYFFQNVRDLFEADDLTIVNLEGPLTTVAKAGKRGGFIFKGDPSYVNILTGSSVELCNIANNHSLDYGKEGLLETRNVLKANDVGYCGFGEVYSATIKGVRVMALGFEWWGSDKNDIVKAVKAARDSCDLLIVNMHWGYEGHREQDARQISIGRAIIDAGADLVIGTHPHVYEGIEKYKGKYIVYSLGNFCFAGNSNPGDKRCLIFQQTFSFNPGMGIVQANILDAGVNVIPCNISSVKELNDFQPTIMAADEGGELLKAVASRSINFTLADTLWMKDNYMVANGLLGEDGKPVTAQAEAAEGELLEEELLEAGQTPQPEAVEPDETPSAEEAATV